MKSVFHKDNLLSYVDKTHDYLPPAPAVPETVVEGNKRNGLAVTAAVLTGVSFLTFYFVIPTVVSAGFSVVALITAFRRGTKKTLATVSLILSMLLFGTGLLVASLLFNLYEPTENIRIPANYSMDSVTGVGYKYSPVTQIPCDVAGICPLTVDVIASSDTCNDGGVLEQRVFSTTTGEVLTDQREFKGLKTEEKASLQFQYSSLPNDVLMLVDAPHIECH